MEIVHVCPIHRSLLLNIARIGKIFLAFEMSIWKWVLRLSIGSGKIQHNSFTLEQRKRWKKFSISYSCRCFYGPTISVYNGIVGYFIDVNKFGSNIKNNNKIIHNNHQLMWSETKTRCNRNVLKFFFHSNALCWYTLKRNSIHTTNNNNNKNRGRRRWWRWQWRRQ